MEGVSEERFKELVQQVKSSGSKCITIGDNEAFSLEQKNRLKQENINVQGIWIPELNRGVTEIICYDNDPKKTREFQNPKAKAKKEPGWGFYPF